MSVNLTTGIIPFTELFERLMAFAKTDSFNVELRLLIESFSTRQLNEE